MVQGTNRFFTERDGVPSALDIRDEARWSPDVRYYGRVLREVDAMLGPRNLTFYLNWQLDLVPSIGQDVVVLLIGDERAQLPSYVGDVLAVFRNGTMRPFDAYAGRPTRRALKVLDRARLLRDAAVRAKRDLPTEHWGRTVFPIPLGYWGWQDLTMRPIMERAVDVFYPGPRIPGPSLTDRATWPIRPRDLARQWMFEAMDEMRRRLPHIRCEALERREGPSTYWSALTNARIALCPRGNFQETFRLAEAALSGCVLISEPVPPTWYFEDHPAYIVSDWREAPELVAHLVAHPEELVERHERTLAWWRETMSEHALAKYIVRKLQRLI